MEMCRDGEAVKFTEACLHPKLIEFSVPLGNLALSPHYTSLQSIVMHEIPLSIGRRKILAYKFPFVLVRSVKMGKMAHGRMQTDFPLKTAQQMSIDVAVEGKTPALGRKIRL